MQSDKKTNSAVSHIEGTRLYFVDPSKVNGFDEKSGVEFTPPYEDMCIAFNLMIETYSRFDEDEINRTGIAGTNKEKEYQLLQGELKTKDGKIWDGEIDESDNNYLTTYYTEISSDGYKEKEKVEGLGVESIQVNYDNYYMPTIVIKFIDVRGSALFGREEAIHSDKSGTGKINANNIFGTFFTIPYPKFKLQIKGFYGQAVTYQLTCSGFEASFNAKTGNVEAVAKFIGYNWALLTDVPFSYLVAAPYCSYIGKEYWDKNKVKDKWKMINSPESGCTQEYPITLYDLHQQIESCTVNTENTGSGATENSMNSDISSRSETLDNLSNAINSFNNSVNNKSVVTSDEIEESKTKNYFDDIVKYAEAYQSYEEGFAQEILNNTEYENGLKEINSEKNIDENNILYTSTTTVSDDVLFKNNFKIIITKKYKYIVTCDVFENIKTWVNKNDSNSNIIDVSDDEISSNRLEERANPYGLNSNDKNFKFYFWNSGRVDKFQPHGGVWIIAKGEQSFKFIKTYSVLNLTDLKAKIEDEKKIIEASRNSLHKKEEQEFIQSVLTKIGIEPNVHNIFKILFCHLETLCHILYETNKIIKGQELQGLRTLSELGVKSIENTDIPSKYNSMTSLPPWTVIFNNNGDTVNNDTKLEYATQYKWVGDIEGGKGKWEEVKVINAFVQALIATQNIPTSSEEYGNEEINGIFTLPCDLNKTSSPFININKDKSYGGICATIGIRAAQLFGINDKEITDDTIIKLLGKIDAYNIYYSCRDINDLKEIFKFNNTDKHLNKDVVIGVATCDKEYQNIADVTNNKEKYNYSFEKYNYIDGRQPIFKQNGNKLTWTYFKDKERNSLVPSVLIDFKDKKGYRDFIQYKNEGSNKYFEGEKKVEHKYDETYGWLYSNKEQIIPYDDKSNRFYFNEDMFKIIDEQSTVESLIKKYNKIKTGTFKILEYQVNDKNFSDFVNRYWKVSFDDYIKSLNSNFSGWYFGKKFEKISNNIIENPIITDGNIWFNVVRKELLEYINTTNNTLHYVHYKLTNNDGYKTFIINNNTDDKITVDDIYFKTLYVFDENGLTVGSLFSHNFYYIQNSDEVKCLLLLQALIHGETNLLYNSLNCEYGNLTIYNRLTVLYVGGLLWRYETMEKDNDPIIYEANGKKYKKYDNESTLTKGVSLYVEKDENNSGESLSGLRTFKEVTGVNISDIDENAKQQLIYYFTNFVNTEFIPSIKPICEFNDFLEKHINGENFQRVNSPYYVIHPTSDNNYYSIFGQETEKAKEIQRKLKSILFDNVIIVNGGKISENKEVTINKDVFSTYTTSLINTIEDICKTVSSKYEVYTSTDEDEAKSKVRDVNALIPIYIYFKNLWEKWLVQSSKTERNDNKTEETKQYDVDSFFKNFVFIDSYYNDISTRLKINLEEFNQIYNSDINEKNLYSVIGDIASKHRCMFVGLPDYVHLGLGVDNENSNEGIKNMENMFRPIPYSQMKSMSVDNHFALIYTYPPASEMPDEYSHRYDGFDIYSFEGDNADLQKIMGDNKDAIVNEDGTVSKYGYNIPSFAISFGKQNNSIFKDFNISMKNPVMTEAAIKTLVEASNKANQNNRAVCFYGQDMYNIYSNYSYQIEVEMMGNAQIQPLMYFQLLNIPMWRGAYMIYQVSHNMTAGNMTTRIKAMKMSKNPVPILSSYWTGKMNDYNNVSISEGSGSSLEYNSNGSIKSNVWNSIGVGNIGNLGASSRNMNNNLGSLRTNGKKCLNSENWENKYINTAHNNYMTDLPKMEFNLSGGKYNLNKVINIIYNLSHYNLNTCSVKNSPYVSGGYCAYNVFTSIGNGFSPFKELATGNGNDPNNLKVLSQLGFKQIYNKSDETYPQEVYPGDIALYDYAPYGHVAMFTGKHWVSDFIQKNGLKSANKGKGVYAVFRIPGIEGSNVKPYNSINSGEAFNMWFEWSRSWEGATNGIVGSKDTNVQNQKNFALNKFWKKFNIDKINDKYLAVITMYVCYWIGNPTFIIQALKNEKYIKDKYPYTTLTTKDIENINSVDANGLFNKIKKITGDCILDPPSNASLASGKDFTHGWRRRWTSINYGKLLLNSQTNAKVTIEEFKNLLTKL